MMTQTSTNLDSNADISPKTLITQLETLASLFYHIAKLLHFLVEALVPILFDFVEPEAKVVVVSGAGASVAYRETGGVEVLPQGLVVVPVEEGTFPYRWTHVPLEHVEEGVYDPTVVDKMYRLRS